MWKKIQYSVVSLLVVLMSLPPAFAQAQSQSQEVKKVKGNVTLQSLDFSKGNEGGCGNLFVFKISADNQVGLSVQAPRKQLELDQTEKSFEIDQTAVLTVQLTLGNNPGVLYCTDVISTKPLSYKKVTAVRGRVRIRLAQASESLSGQDEYLATVILEDVEFPAKDSEDKKFLLKKIILEKIRVGWYPG